MPVGRRAQLRTARKLAVDAFATTGQAFLKEAEGAIFRETVELDKWLAERVAELAPVVVAPKRTFFDPVEPAPAPEPLPTTPAERLAAIHADISQSPRLRNKADALLKIYRKRHDRLKLRGQFAPLEVIPLGLLMVVPAAISDGKGVNHGG